MSSAAPNAVGRALRGFFADYLPAVAEPISSCPVDSSVTLSNM